MGSPFTKPSQLGGGTFFKPADHMNDIALLLEPTRVDKDVENTYNGKTTRRDEVTARITVFKTQEALDKGEPSEVLESGRVVHGMLTSNLSKIIGGATVAVVRKVPTQAGSGYAFRDPEAGVEDKVAAYYTAREAAVAEALNDVPDFD